MSSVCFLRYGLFFEQFFCASSERSGGERRTSATTAAPPGERVRHRECASLVLPLVAPHWPWKRTKVRKARSLVSFRLDGWSVISIGFTTPARHTSSTPGFSPPPLWSVFDSCTGQDDGGDRDQPAQIRSVHQVRANATSCREPRAQKSRKSVVAKKKLGDGRRKKQLRKKQAAALVFFGR